MQCNSWHWWNPLTHIHPYSGSLVRAPYLPFSCSFSSQRRVLCLGCGDRWPSSPDHFQSLSRLSLSPSPEHWTSISIGRKSFNSFTIKKKKYSFSLRLHQKFQLLQREIICFDCYCQRAINSVTEYSRLNKVDSLVTRIGRSSMRGSTFPSVDALTPPGARRVDDEAWKTFGGSFPTLEYVMTDEELNEWVFASVGMLSWHTNANQRHLTCNAKNKRHEHVFLGRELTKFLYIPSILLLMLVTMLSNMPKGFVGGSCANTQGTKNSRSSRMVMLGCHLLSRHYQLINNSIFVHVQTKHAWGSACYMRHVCYID